MRSMLGFVHFIVFSDVLIRKLEIVILLVSLLLRIHTVTSFTSLSWAAIDNSFRNCCSQPVLFHLCLMLYDRQILHGLRDLIVFVTILRLIFVHGSWKQNLQLMMVSLHSSEIFPLLLLLRFHWKQQTHQEFGCVCQRGRGKSDPLSSSAVRVFCASSVSGLTMSILSSA